MPSIQEQVMEFVKKPSKPLYIQVGYQDILPNDVVVLDRIIEPKIRQNERERAASVEAAARCIVGGK